MSNSTPAGSTQPAIQFHLEKYFTMKSCSVLSKLKIFVKLTFFFWWNYLFLDKKLKFYQNVQFYYCCHSYFPRKHFNFKIISQTFCKICYKIAKKSWLQGKKSILEKKFFCLFFVKEVNIFYLKKLKCDFYYTQFCDRLGFLWNLRFYVKILFFFFLNEEKKF